jgi:hypothetical protein
MYFSGVIAYCFLLEFGRRGMDNSKLIGLLKHIATTQYLLVWSYLLCQQSKFIECQYTCTKAQTGKI